MVFKIVYLKTSKDQFSKIQLHLHQTVMQHFHTSDQRDS